MNEANQLRDSLIFWDSLSLHAIRHPSTLPLNPLLFNRLLNKFKLKKGLFHIIITYLQKTLSYEVNNTHLYEIVSAWLSVLTHTRTRENINNMLKQGKTHPKHYKQHY